MPSRPRRRLPSTSWLHRRACWWTSFEHFSTVSGGGACQSNTTSPVDTRQSVVV
jgi:hypothetical protein